MNQGHVLLNQNLLFIIIQLVMTIIVAFILEEFLFRIECRKKHTDDEKGKLLCHSDTLLQS